MADRIDSFTGNHRFLSNFYPSVVTYDNVLYPTVEHAFQAAKTLISTERSRFVLCGSPGEAKRLGQRVTLRVDWEDIKLDVMYDLVREKFKADPRLASRLLATGDAVLVEGNTWGDTFWGVCRGVGENHLGCTLMNIRQELRDGTGPLFGGRPRTAALFGLPSTDGDEDSQ